MSKLTSNICGWIVLLWIYLKVGWHFCQWRLQLFFSKSYMVERTQTSMKQTLLLIRHGQTSWNVEHRLPGQIPGVELNEKGRQQASRLEDALTVIPISAIISSPLVRAHETAGIIAQQYKLEIQLDPEHSPRVLAIGWNPQPGWLKLPSYDLEKLSAESHVEG